MNDDEERKLSVQNQELPLSLGTKEKKEMKFETVCPRK